MTDTTFHIAPWTLRVPGSVDDILSTRGWQVAGTLAGMIVLSVNGEDVMDGPFPTSDAILSKRGRMFVRAPLKVDGFSTVWVDGAQRSGQPMRLAIVGSAGGRHAGHFFPTARLSPVRYGQEGQGSRVVAFEWEVGHTGYRELA